MLSNTPIPYKHFLKEWLEAKVLFLGEETQPHAGTPQGGVISPHLANIALAGLEEHVKSGFSKSYKTRKSGKRITTNKINIVRYADDFVITCATRYMAEEVVKLTNEFLKVRGLNLNPDKTKITKVKDGFEFLGFRFKLYDKLGVLVVPSKSSTNGVRRQIKDIFKKGRQAKIAKVIMDVNAVLRG